MTDESASPDGPLQFRPRARLLQLLGDELIGNPRLAVFELVKNSYDADANSATVRFALDKMGRASSLTVEDDGEGMAYETIRDVWLSPGHDYRAKQRAKRQRSPNHGRLPLGEKGLGRFAVHKLGDHIKLVTRARDADECVVDIDWDALIAKPFLSDAPVTVTRRPPEVFQGEKTGTKVIITRLRQPVWTRGDVRRLYRQITSIASPFSGPSGFDTILDVPGCEHWISDIPDVSQILSRSFWVFRFSLDSGRLDWSYKFRGFRSLKLEGRELSGEGDTLLLPSLSGDDRMTKKVTANQDTTDDIGPITGEFYVYDRDREVLRRQAETQLLESYLDENGGIRVYRDGIRVYNYGERGDDWLGLDLRRVNAPTRRLSRNIILGAVHLSLEASTALVEKTNREGFVENDAQSRLRQVVLGALGKFENERQIDKDHIRSLTAKAPDPETAGIQQPLAELRGALDQRQLLGDFEPYLQRIEQDYRDMQSTLLTAGMSGLNLAVVFHEVERAIRALHTAIVDGSEPSTVELQARDLMRLMEGFSTLLRRDSKRKHTARALLEAARRFSILRIRHHGVTFECPLLDGKKTGFEAKFSFGVVLGALNNLVDNSLYWLRVRWPDAPDSRRLLMEVVDDLNGHPAIVVADNGPGLQDDPARIVMPFVSRKPDGMGLGLYYSNLAIELNGGQLVFPEPGDVELPDEYDGAVIALSFGGET